MSLKKRMPNSAEKKNVSAPEKLRLFQLKNISKQEDWTALEDILVEYPEAKGVEGRLSHLLGNENLTIGIELQYIDKDFRDTFSAYFSKRFHTPSTRCARLHFFRGILNPEQVLAAELPEGAEYLGYSVLRPLHTGGLGRTLIASRLLPVPNGQHAHYKTCEEKVSLLGRSFTVRGFPYIAQDQEVFVCAQAALWMLVRYFSNSYPNYREMGPYQLANLVSDFSLGRTFPSQGLELWQASEILRRLGFHPVIHARESFTDSMAAKLGFKTADEGFRHLFYTYIESGIPLLVAYKTHAVVAFGHVSDYRRKPEKASASADGIFHSSVWNRAFLVHDDAKLPYMKMEIPVKTDKAQDGEQVPSEARSFDAVRAFIAPMPEKTFLSADSYQRMALGLLKSEEFGAAARCPELSKAMKANEIVLRSFLTTGTSFKRTIMDRGMLSGFSDAYRHYSLPHFIWITEIHCLANYPEKCIGQVVWDATCTHQDAESFLFLHYPNGLIVNSTPHFNRQRGRPADDLFEIPLDNPPAEFISFQPFKNNLPKTT